MFVLTETVYRDGDVETYVMGVYDEYSRALKNQKVLESQVDIDDGLEYDICSVPVNLDFEVDDDE